MQVEKLEIAQCRVFNQATFDFKSGMNLLVGVNGAGKSTVLDILRRMFSYALPSLSAARFQSIPFEVDDIKLGRDSMTLQSTFVVHDITIDHLVHYPREKTGSSNRQFIDELQTAVHVDRRRRIELRRERVETDEVVELNDLFPRQPVPRNVKRADEQPLVVFFSTYRSVPNERDPGESVSLGGQAAAFGDALVHRQLNIAEFARWWFVQQTLSEEGLEKARRRVDVLSQTVTEYLEGYHNLRAVVEPKPTLLVDKADETLNIRMLSDGERSILALILDMTRRLTQANPQLDNPTEDGKAIILIDELDLHLHPSWQRTIVDRLTTTFPNCQFICSTHSPQIVGEVPPEQIILIMDGKAQRPDQSLGMDTNWILRHLMGVAERDTDTQQALNRIQDLIDKEAYDEARTQIDALRARLGEFSALVELQTEIDMIEFLDDDWDDEADA